MKPYLGITALLLACLAGLTLVVELLEVPLLVDPAPWLAQGGPVAALVGLGLLVADVALPVPSSAVMLANGALFGLALGTSLSLLGSVGAALLGFGLGRAGGPLVERLVAPEARRRADRLLVRWGLLAIAVTRPVPLLAEATAIAAGASPLGWARVGLAALLGTLPAALLYALAGAAAVTFEHHFALLGLTLLVTVAVWLVGSRAAQPRGQRISEQP